ncbi:hypothetical protein Sipo8835_41485 [Streptomyces ipomoeae]|uniref:Uncharacterized protein n=1 Tax=Streptomyces ipomoeae TaxID=103232 RepID=A0AAE9AWN6_9ACTN|nr:hypothetical protein Sipo8835_41485 [Streptomyces ipomoeae]TQE29252.1 hypothetical protein Sipo7851_28865 [Streptomyces ipomoeae]
MRRAAQVVMIGDGRAGLTVGHHPRRLGLDFVILDARTEPNSATATGPAPPDATREPLQSHLPRRQLWLRPPPFSGGEGVEEQRMSRHTRRRSSLQVRLTVAGAGVLASVGRQAQERVQTTSTRSRRGGGGRTEPWKGHGSGKSVPLS